MSVDRRLSFLSRVVLGLSIVGFAGAGLVGCVGGEPAVEESETDPNDPAIPGKEGVSIDPLQDDTGDPATTGAGADPAAIPGTP